MTSHDDGHGELGHILPFSVYRNSFLALIALTIITVLISRFDFGSFNFVIAMLIASVKAGIVALFFMHLRYESPVIWACLGVPVILLFILLIGLFIDEPFRGKYTPAVLTSDQPKASEAVNTPAHAGSHSE